MKKNFCFVFCLLVFSQVFALSQLPRSSYLKLGDNQREVKILQEILNSDRSTEVTDVGPGSPGNENWYFGKMTESALKKFQEKSNLEVTGRIDFKTWRKINDYVLGVTPTPDPSPIVRGELQSKIQSADEKRKNINEQNKKDFEAARKLAAEKKQADAKAKNEESTSYIQNLIDKYTGFFYTNKNDAEQDNQSTGLASNNTNTLPTQDTYSNNYSAQTPYLNPNTGVYSSNPIAASQPIGQPQSIQQTPGLNPFLPAQQNPYINYGQPAQITNNPGTPQQLPITTAPAESIPCNIDGVNTDTKSGQGWVCGKGSYFGHKLNGTFDSQDNGLGCFRKDGGRHSTRSGAGIAIPIWLQQHFFGSSPTGKSPSVGCDGWVEVVNKKTGQCMKFKVVDTGPDPRVTGGRIIDFTGTACNMIKCVTDEIYCFRKAATQGP